MATSRAGGRAAAAAAKSGNSSKGKAAKISGRKAAATSSSSSSKRTGKSKAKSTTNSSSINSSSSANSSSKLRVVACDEDEESHSITAKQAERDAFLSHFHALGKLLYAKRTLPESSISSSGSSRAGAVRAAKAEAEAALGADYYKLPLEFSPEDVLHRSSLSVDGAAAFLQVSCAHIIALHTYSLLHHYCTIVFAHMSMFDSIAVCTMRIRSVLRYA
jgi:hypothetical protein